MWVRRPCGRRWKCHNSTAAGGHLPLLHWNQPHDLFEKDVALGQRHLSMGPLLVGIVKRNRQRCFQRFVYLYCRVIDRNDEAAGESIVLYFDDRLAIRWFMGLCNASNMKGSNGSRIMLLSGNTVNMFLALPLWMAALACAILWVGCDAVVETENSAGARDDQEPRSYSKHVERIASNEIEAALIDSAEAVYPPRDSVVAAVPDIYRITIPAENHWYWWHFDGVLIPYAITAEAVEYYSRLIDDLKIGIGMTFLRQADLRYVAEVRFHERYTFAGTENGYGDQSLYDDYENVYVVAMSLEWNQRCGMECGMNIRHKRLVVFDAEGNLIRVHLDGRSPVTVS